MFEKILQTRCNVGIVIHDEDRERPAASGVDISMAVNETEEVLIRDRSRAL